jgi:hypothetical protein
MASKRSLHLALFSTLLACTASKAREPRFEPHFDPTTLSPDDPRAHCVVGRWCWLDGEPFVAMHGLTVEGVVAASARGEMWRFNGSGWEPLGFPVFLARPSIFAVSESDVWVAGEGRLFHYDGAAWTERDAAASGAPSGQWPLALRGTGSSDLWAYGSAGMSVMHFDGMRWSAWSFAGQVTDLLAVREGEAWAIEEFDARTRLTIRRFDGSDWVEMATARGIPIRARLASVDDEVWFTGEEPRRFVEGESLPLDPALYSSDETTRRTVSASGRLIALPDGPRCEDVHLAGTTTFCNQGDALISYSTDTVTWTRTALDTLEATMPPDAFDDYAPNVWAGEAELAFGLAPEGAVRFRPVEADTFTGAPRFMLERASLAGTFEPVTREGEPMVVGSAIDIDGAPLGPTFLVMDDSLHVLSPEGEVTRVELPSGLSASIDRVAAIDADSAIFVAHADANAELVLRLDGGSVRTLMEQRARAGVGSVEIEDVAVDAEGGLWVIGTAEGPTLRAQRVLALFHSSDGEAWARRDLWPTWGGAQLVAHGDALWIFVFGEGVYRLPRTVMRGTGPVVPEILLDRTRIEYRLSAVFGENRLHVDETGVWLSANDRALWLPR